MNKLSKKIALVGAFGVGKTSLFRRFIDDAFSEDYKSTLGVQIQKKVIAMDNGTTLSMILWDTEGHEEISESRSAYLLGSHAFVYVFDLTRIDTYKNINKQIDFLKKSYPNVLIKIVGNKIDTVALKKVQESLEEHQVNYDCLTSAKTGENVPELFVDIAVDLTN
ncbi:Rab family GTPase [Aquimarina agarivorans]|uniref:Rab family GTPase n=1 Tax=Aquimarina agarivorans TaxID=980584 RepID=UPI000248E6F5|nr:Rab family GTPase [Aquimarina agarivorans]